MKIKTSNNTDRNLLFGSFIRTQQNPPKNLQKNLIKTKNNNARTNKQKTTPPSQNRQQSKQLDNISNANS